jgi:hypothetical protein
MSESTSLTGCDATVMKLAAYAAFQAAQNVTLFPEHTAIDVADAERAKADYLREEIPGNANPYVTWDDPAIEFQCPTCDVAITAKQEHPLHREDQELLERYPARLDNVM